MKSTGACCPRVRLVLGFVTDIGESFEGIPFQRLSLVDDSLSQRHCSAKSGATASTHSEGQAALLLCLALTRGQDTLNQSLSSWVSFFRGLIRATQE